MKKRILYYSEGWGLGGIESFIMMMIRHLDHERYHCDIYCTHDWSDVYDDELHNRSVHRYVLYHAKNPNLVIRTLESPSAFGRIVRNNHYDVVHINTMNATGFLYAHQALLAGVPCVIVHSHSSSVGTGNSCSKRFVHLIGRKVWQPDNITRLAVSTESGEYLFGDKPFTVVHNGINVRKFCFDPVARAQTRSRLGISDRTFLFGAVGRLSEPKNPLFQLDILEYLIHHGVSCKLLLVGKGPMADKIAQQARYRNLADDMLLLSQGTAHPERYYCALDAFTMPSLFEGAPIALLEAVCSGLPILASASLKNLKLDIPDIGYLPLDSCVPWAGALKQMSQVSVDQHHRVMGMSCIQRAGYSDTAAVSVIEHFYELTGDVNHE